MDGILVQRMLRADVACSFQQLLDHIESLHQRKGLRWTRNRMVMEKLECVLDY